MNKLYNLTIILCFALSQFSFAQHADIDPKLYIQLQKKSTTDALIVFNATPDFTRATLISDKRERRVFVANLIAKTAIDAQKNVANFLKDNNLTYSPYSVVNCIYVPAINKTALLQIAAFTEVKEIIHNATLRSVSDVALGNNSPVADRAGIEWGIKNIKADSVWMMGYTGTGVVVGGEDTGYNWTHAAIKNKYRGWNGTTATHDYNWYNAVTSVHFQWGANNANSCGYNPIEPCDDGDHGTHTMGTMIGDDGLGNQIGVAPNAKWIGARNMDRGWGLLSWYVGCFEWFLRPTPVGVAPSPTTGDPSKAPDVINNSWGCPPPPDEDCTTATFSTMDAAINNLEAAGVVVVVSAGNDGSACSTINNPAAIFQNSFTVGASDIGNNIASFSSRGPVTVDGSNRLKPNVSAPGVNVRSCVPGTNTYGSKNGTSMAGPHVAGAVAVLLSASPSLTVAQVKYLLESKAQHNMSAQNCGGVSGATVPNNTFGNGIINLKASVLQALVLLPIRIVSFNAFAEKNNVKLVWASEEDEKGNYIIEKTTDGRLWETVAKTASIGSGNHQYTATDESPYIGANYYRLRHIDIDGDEHEGKIVQVNFSGTKSAQIHVSPNPAQDVLKVWTSGLEEANTTVQLIDNQGRIILNTSINTTSEATISLENIANGIYFLRINELSQKVVVFK